MQDWVSIAVEVLIVVIGVFLGIQAANWNEERQDRVQERRYLEQIVTDLKRDVVQLETAQKRSLFHDAAAETLITALHRGIPGNVTPDRFAKDVHFAGFLYLPSPNRRTYDELISTGNLRLIRDLETKDAIAAYYQSFAENRQWDGLLRQQQANYWSATAGIIPRKTLQAVLQETDSGTSAAEARQILAKARATPRLENMLIGMAAHQARVRRDSIALKAEAEALIKRLQQRAD